MNKQISALAARVTYVSLVLAWSANTGLAADKVNYSGKYLLQVRKTASGGENDSTLDVVQNEKSVDITRSAEGRRMTNRYPLNGSEGDYTSPGGVSGKCKAQLKGKYLVLESVVFSRPQSSSPPVRIHTRERWQLSADSNVLTIKSDVDFPDFPGDISTVVGAYGSSTQKYTRTKSP